MDSERDTLLSGSTALVTGAGGFIGQRLVAYLRSVDVPVIGVGHAGRVRSGIPVDHVLDLERPEVLDRWLNEDTVVFHLAGSADVPRSVRTPVLDYSANLALTFGVLEAVRTSGSRIIFPSSGAVYDSNAPTPFAEDTRLGPSSPYGAAKMAVEAYLHAYRRSYGIDARVARIFSVYGPGMSRFAIFDFYRRLKAAPERLILRGDGSQVRDYLFVDDVARALVYIMSYGEKGGVYNVASGTPLTMLEVARAVAEKMGLENTEFDVDGTRQPGDLHTMLADTSALTALDFRCATSFDAGLKTTIDWFEQNVSKEPE